MSRFTRKEMREELEIRGYSERTITIYTHHMVNLTEYFNKAPHKLKAEDIHAYQVYLVKEKQVSWAFFNQAVCAMRFFLTMW